MVEDECNNMYYLRLDTSHPAAMQLIKFSLYPDCSTTWWFRSKTSRHLFLQLSKTISIAKVWVLPWNYSYQNSGKYSNFSIHWVNEIARWLKNADSRVSLKQWPYSPYLDQLQSLQVCIGVCQSAASLKRLTDTHASHHIVFVSFDK